MTPLQLTRRRPEVTVGLLLAATVAWWWTVRRMSGMDGGPGADLGTLGWFTGSWVVMMAAMMLPSLAPSLAAYATAGRAPTRWLLFAGGYLLTWTGAGMLAYGVVELGRHLGAGQLGWRHGGRWLSAALIAAAVAYQFAPIKRACLARCRGELKTQNGATAHGPWFALALGARNGVLCIGCSGALMAALFALGVMSLTWMTLIAVLVALEKTAPWPRAARIATATMLGVLAVGILVAPHHVPGLVVPSATGTHAMRAMG